LEGIDQVGKANLRVTILGFFISKEGLELEERLVALLLEICMAFGKLGMTSFMHVFFVKVVFLG